MSFLASVVRVCYVSLLSMFVGCTSLMDAVIDGDLETAREMIDEGSEVDERDHYERTPLMLASLHGNTDLVELLVERGAVVDEKDRFGDTPLIKAAKRDQTTVAVFLIQQGADVHARGVFGQSAFRYALESSSGSLVESLIDRGVDLNATWDTSYEATWLDEENVGLVAFALDDGYRDENPSDTTPLLWALDEGKMEIAGMLMEKGASPLARNVEGKTALMAGARTGDLQFLERLINRGADVNAQDTDGQTVLQYVGREDVLTFLFDRGARVQPLELARQEDGYVAEATARSHRAYAKYLEKKGSVAHADEIVGSYREAAECYDQAAQKYDERARYFAGQATKIGWLSFARVMVDPVGSAVSPGPDTSFIGDAEETMKARAEECRKAGAECRTEIERIKK